MLDLSFVIGPIATGYVAALIRVGAFVVATPILSTRLPATGRLVLTLAVSLLLARPIDAIDTAQLVGIALSNAGIGLALGFLTGIVFRAFFIAGSLIDQMAGLGIGATLDPLTGANASVFDRFLDLTATTLLIVSGGLSAMVLMLAGSIEAIPLDGGAALRGDLPALLADQVGLMMITAIEVAAPALVALFVVEVVLAVSARLLPQANVFIVGLPPKLLVAIVTAGAVLVALPMHVDRYQDISASVARLTYLVVGG